MAADDATWPAAGANSHGKAADSKVLMVGAGGIGCELLKTLVLSGFRNITVVDMDTIDISNLNRQFLFRRRHVGQSKARVAAEAVRAFCPAATITAMVDNVMTPGFDVPFIKTFSLVLNGLDNDEARRHVNRLCLAADVPLIESGTTGYKGQVVVCLPGQSECYECVDRPKPQGYPICTIRNTPDKPIHCIAWAKDLLFERLLGPPDQTTDLDEATEAEDPADEGAPKLSEFLRGDEEGAWSYSQRVFDLLFHADIKRLAGMEALWEKREPPMPLPPAAEVLQGWTPPDCEWSSLLNALELNPRKMWTVLDLTKVFCSSLYLFHHRRAADVGRAHFTKDDALAVNLVAAAANLRSRCYRIPEQTEFDAKGMASNIIHAIATTNAIIAGYIVIEAVKLLTVGRSHARLLFLTGSTPNQYGKCTMTLLVAPPQPGCPACGRSIMRLTVNTEAYTLQRLLEDVVRGELRIRHGALISEGFMFEDLDAADLDEDEVEEHAAVQRKPLAKLPGRGLAHGTSLTVMDHSDGDNVLLYVLHSESEESFILEGERKLQPTRASSSQGGPAPKVGNANSAASVPHAPTGRAAPVIIIDDDDDLEVIGTFKRKGAPVEVDDDTVSGAKAMKLSE